MFLLNERPRRSLIKLNKCVHAIGKIILFLNYSIMESMSNC